MITGHTYVAAFLAAVVGVVRVMDVPALAAPPGSSTLLRRWTVGYVFWLQRWRVRIVAVAATASRGGLARSIHLGCLSTCEDRHLEPAEVKLRSECSKTYDWKEVDSNHREWAT